MTENREETVNDGPRILVVGVGGGGNNAVDRMIEAGVQGAEFAAVNTDMDVLNNSRAQIKLQIGKKLLNGYGAGADPSLGESAAQENEEDICRLVQAYDMVILASGMGGGTGTGAAPFIAGCCKEAAILTVGVVTLPFSFESAPRIAAAEAGIARLKEEVDTLLVIPNDKLLGLTDKPLLLTDAFQMADSVLKYIIQGIANIVFNRGMVNIDFNDMKTALKGKGIGHMGVGMTDADGSILDAVKQAVDSPLLDTTITGAENLLINTSGNMNITALSEAMNYIRELAGEKVNIIWGTVSGEQEDNDKMIVTLIATGMEREKTEVSENHKKTEVPKTEEIRRKEILTRPISSNLRTKPQREISIPPFLNYYANYKN